MHLSDSRLYGSSDAGDSDCSVYFAHIKKVQDKAMIKAYADTFGCNKRIAKKKLKKLSTAFGE